MSEKERNDFAKMSYDFEERLKLATQECARLEKESALNLDLLGACQKRCVEYSKECERLRELLKLILPIAEKYTSKLNAVIHDDYYLTDYVFQAQNALKEEK